MGMKFRPASKLRKESRRKHNQHDKQGQLNTFFLKELCHILKAILFVPRHFIYFKCPAVGACGAATSKKKVSAARGILENVQCGSPSV